MLSLLLLSCSPETAASTVALRYAGTILVDPAAQSALVCAEDRAAKTVDEIAAEIAGIKAGLGATAVDAALAKAARRTTAVATISPDGTQATVVLSVPHGTGPDVPPETATFTLAASGATWCVVTGWALDKKIAALTDAGVAAAAAANGLIADWRFDEAEAKIIEEETLLAGIPADRAEHAAVNSNIVALRALLVAARTGWVGGRWRVTEDVDPMTDEKNVIARLESTDGLPNAIGMDKPATLIARCNRGTLDLFIATDSMLDSDWRYDSVAGQYRFDAEPPERLAGSRSTDYKAMFLRSPGAWLDRLASRDGATWAVELPLYQRKPATVHFDLAATATALARIPKECR